MAASAQKIRQTGFKKPFRFALIKNKLAKKRKVKRSNLWGFLQEIVYFIFCAQQVKEIEPGRYEKVEPRSMNFLGLVK